MSQNCNDIIEPRETDEQRAARENRLAHRRDIPEIRRDRPGKNTPTCCNSCGRRNR